MNPGQTCMTGIHAAEVVASRTLRGKENYL
jgi:hypothetical protein